MLSTYTHLCLVSMLLTYADAAVNCSCGPEYYNSSYCNSNATDMYTPVNMPGTMGNSCNCPCGNEVGCKIVNVVKVNISDRVCQSPYYADMSNSAGITVVNSICTTYFKITKVMYIRIRYTTLIAGGSIFETVIQADVPGCPGITTSQGLRRNSGCSTVTTNEYVLGYACPGVPVLYVCVKSGDVGMDTSFVRVIANTTQVSDCCKQRAIDIAVSQGFIANFTILPQKGHKCVTCVNGMRAINADKVDPEDAVTLSD